MFLNLPLLGAGVEIGKLEMKPRNRVTAWWPEEKKDAFKGALSVGRSC
jgi:hypothetical protein